MNGKKVDEFRSNPITLALWENEVEIEGEIKILPNITIVRWVGKRGAWKPVHNFRVFDLPHIMNVIQQYRDKYPDDRDVLSDEEYEENENDYAL